MNDAFVRIAYEETLGRSPTEYEVQEARYLADRGGMRDFLLHLCVKRPDRPLGAAEARPLFVPPDHYYSPIVNSQTLADSGFVIDRDVRRLDGIAIDFDEMLATFKTLSLQFSKIEFPEHAEGTHRYFFQNDFYSYGDAIIYSAMLLHFRPSLVVEVGSGFSSAVLLDTIETAGLSETRCIFIEPYPDRLRGLLRPADTERVTIIEKGVQVVDPIVFESLNSGDVLFIDSTHVSKTGSDVNHEIFQILPLLNQGVIVHFHDVFWPFEYPDTWVFDENRSWNELYLLRAFLMNNNEFEVLFFNDLVRRHFAFEVEAVAPLITRNGGGGLWLRKR